MKYAARIFLCFLVFFFISEVSYQISEDVFAKEPKKPDFITSYLEALDYSVPRVLGRTKIVVQAEGIDEGTADLLQINSSEIAGMEKEELCAYLEKRPIPAELVFLGITKLQVKQFTRYEVVIEALREEPGSGRSKYWCYLKDGCFQVFDGKREELVLEQMIKDESIFSLEERRALQEGYFVDNYDEVAELLGKNKGR